MVESLTNPNALFWFDDTPHKEFGETEVADYCVKRAAPLTFAGTQPLTATMQSYCRTEITPGNGRRSGFALDCEYLSGPELRKGSDHGRRIAADRMAITDQDGVLVAVKAASAFRSHYL